MWLRIALVLNIFFILPSCEKKEVLAQEKPIVLVSVAPYTYFVEKIAGDLVQVNPLVPPGANPHLYEATPKEVQHYQRASLWFYLGESLDKRLLEVFRQTRNSIQIVDLAQKIPLLSHCDEKEIETGHHHHDHCEGADLHIWLSPILAKEQARTIASALIELLPHHQKTLEGRLSLFLEELDQLNHKIAFLLQPMRGKAILVSHPAFAYFCQNYELVQLSVEIEGKDPLPKDVAKILSQAKEYSIQSVFLEPQYSNKGAELIAESLKLPTHMVDPYSANYLNNLLHIAEVIAE